MSGYVQMIIPPWVMPGGISTPAWMH